MKKIFLFIPFFVFGFVACSDDDDIDTTKPTIGLVSPTDGTAFHPGETIEFNCDFSDNDELASYKIEVHSNFDGHEHATVQLKSNMEDDHDHEEGHAWSYNEEWSFEEGQSTASVMKQITIPEHIDHDGVEEEVAAGPYHLGVYCLDVAGNQIEFFIEIEIEHEEHVL